jgi:hypothetical protein
VQRGFYNAGLFYSWFGQFINLVIPTMFMWALILRMVIFWWEVFNVFTIQAMRSLLGGYIERMGFFCD